MIHKSTVEMYRRNMMMLVSSVIGGVIVLFSLKEKPNINNQLLAILFLTGFAAVLALEVFIAFIFRKRR